MAKTFYKVENVMDGVYAMTNCVTCMYLIVGKEKALLFDTGYGFADPNDIIRGITDKPLIAVNSHGHFDHMGGNYLLDCPTYLHEKDLETAARHSSPEYRTIAVKSIRTWSRVGFWMNWIPKTLDQDAYIHQQPFKDYLPVVDGDIFDLGGTTLEVVEMPGHTPGSIGLYCKEKSLMLVSDATNRSVFLFLPESTPLSVYIQSLKHALEKDFDYFLIGHETTLKPRKEMETYLDVVENLDWEGGIRQTHPMRPDGEIRKCTRKGWKPRGKIPCVVISRDKL